MCDNDRTCSVVHAYNMRCISREKVVVLQDKGSEALRELGSQAYLWGLPTYLVDDVNKTLVRQN